VSNARGGVDLVGHQVVPAAAVDLAHLPFVTNMIIDSSLPASRWLKEATTAIGEWRAKLRSTYLRWALSINGLEVAAKQYADSEWSRRHAFEVKSMRPVPGDFDELARIRVKETHITLWDGPTASENHRNTMPMLAAFGVIDLYARLEEFVFALYRIYLNHHPDTLLKGNDYKDQKRLRREAAEDDSKKAEWEKAWRKRLNAWQRKKLYEGLGNVFKAFCSVAHLEKPSGYQVSSIATWAESIDIVGLVRHSLVHGVAEVTAELADGCNKLHAMLFDFEKGEPLAISLYHLQGVDCFCEQLLTGLNISMVELQTSRWSNSIRET
jgi:hypothetical protein